MPLLELHDLSKRFGPVHALRSLSLSLPDGTHSLVVGPSGSGKSTLLRILAGLESPDSGSVRSDGSNLLALPPERRGCGWLGQNHGLLPHLDIAGQWALALRLRGITSQEAASRIAGMALQLDLNHRLHHLPGSLSGGEATRAVLGRALILQPRILLLDEPFAHLDGPLRRHLGRLLHQLHSTHRFTLVHVSHHPAESIAYADLVVCLDQGRLVQAATPVAAYQHPATPWIADILGRDPVWVCPLDQAATRGLIGLDLLNPPPTAHSLGLRPESLTWSSSRPSLPALGPVRIRRCHPIGHALLVEALWSESESLQLSLPRNAPPLQPDDTGYLGFSPDDCLWFSSPAPPPRSGI